MADEMELGEGRKSGGMKIIILVLVLVVLGGAAVGLRVFAPGLIPGWGEKPDAPASQPAAASSGSGATAELGVILPLKPFIVNLRDPMGKRYLKLELSLEVPNEEVKMEVEKKLPPIRNDILLLLSSMSYEDIADAEGKRRLRRRIKDNCDRYLATGKVTNVYFSDFVVQ